MDGSFINMQEKTEFGSFGPQVEFDAPEVEVAPTTGNISNVPEPDTFSYKRGKTVEQRGKDLGEWTKKTIESTTGNMDDSEYTPFVSEAMYLAAQALDKLGIPEQIERVGRFQQRSADPYDSNMYGIDETGLIPIIHRQLKPEAKEALTDLAGWLDPGMAGGAGIVKGWRSQLQNFLETQTKPRSAQEWKQFLGGAVKKPDTFGAEELQMSGISDFLEKANPKEKITPEELVYVYQTNEIPMEVSKVINDPELRRYKEEFDQVKDLYETTRTQLINSRINIRDRARLFNLSKEQQDTIDYVVDEQIRLGNFTDDGVPVSKDEMLGNMMTRWLVDQKDAGIELMYDPTMQKLVAERVLLQRQLKETAELEREAIDKVSNWILYYGDEDAFRRASSTMQGNREAVAYQLANDILLGQRDETLSAAKPSIWGNSLALPRRGLAKDNPVATNYREFIITQPDNWQHRIHFEDKGLWGHLRVENRVTGNSGEIPFVMEMQSDRIQQGSRRGFSDKPQPVGGAIPDAPFKKEDNIFLTKTALKQMKEEGATKVAFPAHIDTVGNIEQWPRNTVYKLDGKDISEMSPVDRIEYFDMDRVSKKQLVDSFDIDRVRKQYESEYPNIEFKYEDQWYGERPTKDTINKLYDALSKGDKDHLQQVAFDNYLNVYNTPIKDIQTFLAPKHKTATITTESNWGSDRARFLAPFYEKKLPDFLKQFGKVEADMIDGKYPVWVLDISTPKAQKQIDKMTDYGRVVEQPHSDLGAGATKSSGDLTKKWQDLFLGTDPSRVPIFRAGVRWKGEVNLAPLQRGAGGDYLSSHPYAKGYGEEGAEPGYMCPDEVFRTRKQMIPYIEREFGIIIHDPDADMWDDGLERFTAEGVEDVLRKGKVKDEIKKVGIKIKDADTGKEYAEGGVVDTADLREKLDISEQPFDPMGTGYDYSTALREGLGMDETGHWPSRAPQSGQLLKGRQHPTYNLTEQGEAEAGYAIQTRADNRGYSAPAFERLTQGVYQDDAGNIFQVTKEGDIIPLGGEKFTRTNNSGIMSK